MGFDKGTITNATVVTISLLAVVGLLLAGATPAAAQSDNPGFDFTNDGGDFGFQSGDSNTDTPGFDFGGGNDSDDGEPNFDFGGGDDGGPNFDFGGGDDGGPDFDFGGGDDGGPDFDFGDGNDSDDGDQPNVTFVPTISGTNSPVTVGETLDVTATVENVGTGDGLQTVTLTVDGVRDSQTVTLSNGESTTLTLSWDTQVGDAGNYTALVDTATQSAQTDVTVRSAGPGTPPNFQVSNLQAPAEATVGDTITVSADVENTGDQQGTQSVEFGVDTDGDGSLETLASQSETLASGASTTVTFNVDTTGLAADTYTHGVSTTNDTETAQITLNPETVQNGTVAGTVTNASSDALPGATVLAGGETTTTAADGSYSLSLEPGSYQVTANADGFQPANETATVTESNTTTVDFSLTAENDDGGDGIVDLDGPTEFTGYVLGDESYLHTGTEDNDRPLTYSRCRDGQPDPAEQDPGFLPTNDCITVQGTAYPSNNSWVGDLNITPVTGIINDTQEENFENIYFNADFSTVDGAQGTFDTQTGETSLETTVAIDVSIWPVGPTIFDFNSPAQNPYSSRTNLLTEDTCEIPNTQIVASTEKSYTTASPFPSTDTVSGERLNRSLSGKVVTDDFSVESATGCGSYFGVNLTEQVNIEQGIPAPSGENELAYDIELDLQNDS